MHPKGSTRNSQNLKIIAQGPKLKGIKELSYDHELLMLE